MNCTLKSVPLVIHSTPENRKSWIPPDASTVSGKSTESDPSTRARPYSQRGHRSCGGALLHKVSGNLLIGIWTLIAGFGFVLAPALCCAGDSCQRRHAVDEFVNVAHVSDGDTLRLVDGRRVRLLGINAPEIAHDDTPADPFGVESKSFLARLLRSRNRVGLVYGRPSRDKYNRILAYVYRDDGMDVARAMLQRGLAFLLVMPPNIEYAECYGEDERTARIGRTGLWSHPEYQPRLAADFALQQHGFRVIKGRVRRLRHTSRSLWLEMKNIRLRIDRAEQEYFTDLPDERWIGSIIVAEGWVNSFKGRLYMRIRHPSALRRIPQ